jgi:lauroyl/myristoyl acyltransferase
VTLVDRLAPVVPLARQPYLARKIAEVIASRPSSMGNDMFLRQSIIRGGTATRDHVIEGLAAWITVLFDLGNLRYDRNRALDLKVEISEGAIVRLARAMSQSRNGCILAVPHIGSIELFVAHLKDRGINLGFVYTIGETPTPTERWILEGRAATGATPIAFGRRNTGIEISKILRSGGVVLMVVDVYPSTKYKGIRVNIHEAEFSYPPGPARFARSGTLVLPGFASRRDARGVSLNILEPLEYLEPMPGRDAIVDLTQKLAVQIASFTTQQPAAYWLWHPIPNDPFLAAARRHRPDLLSSVNAAFADDEAVALAVQALHSRPTMVTKVPPDWKKPTVRPSLRAD